MAPPFPLLPSALLPPLSFNNPSRGDPPRPVLEAPFFLGLGPLYSSTISSSDSESDSEDFMRLDVCASEIDIYEVRIGIATKGSKKKLNRYNQGFLILAFTHYAALCQDHVDLAWYIYVSILMIFHLDFCGGQVSRCHVFVYKEHMPHHIL